MRLPRGRLHLMLSPPSEANADVLNTPSASDAVGDAVSIHRAS